ITFDNHIFSVAALFVISRALLSSFKYFVVVIAFDIAMCFSYPLSRESRFSVFLNSREIAFTCIGERSFDLKFSLAYRNLESSSTFLSKT
ncbi:hypothetical protein ALC57_14388, partial [Trachymyrmex cornetzi]